MLWANVGIKYMQRHQTCAARDRITFPQAEFLIRIRLL